MKYISLALFIFCTGCSSGEKGPGNVVNDLSAGKQKASPQTLNKRKEVAAFKKNWPKWKEGSMERLIDITGDGIPDTLRMQFQWIGKEAYRGIAQIFTHGKTAYSDTIIVDKDYDEYFLQGEWENDSAYFRNLPYSRFYELYDLGKYWLTSPEKGNSDLFENSVASALTRRYLAENDIAEEELERKTKEKLIELKNSKVLLFSNLSFEDPDAYVWDEEFEKFFEVYAP